MTNDEAIRILDPETSHNALVKMMGGHGGWISVSDALPGMYENVLVYCPNTKMARKVEIDYLESLHWSDEWKHGPVTHWQPLPELPKEN